ncbi:MAG: DMT family transporter [Candidatus Polarisedimenticolaceae bacterium]|nr:DMT family transporter [Candidatus Polarisedimenticolaceae bacterium]
MMRPESLRNNPPLFGLLCVITAAFAFSTKAVIIKLAYGYGAQITPINLMCLRMLMSLPFFLLVLFFLERKRGQKPLLRQDFIRLLGLGVVGFYFAAYLDFVGLSYISASLERLILLLYPTFVVLLSAIFLRRAIHLREGLALLVSYIGIVVVFYEALTLDGPNIMFGSLLILGSAIAFAIYLVGCGEMVKRLGSMRFTAYAMTIACLATLLHFGLSSNAVITGLPQQVYGLALLMAVVSTVIPTFLMNAGIHRLGASPAAIISAMGPVSTIFLAYLILDERLTTVQFLGAGLVMLGVLVISTKRAVIERCESKGD